MPWPGGYTVRGLVITVHYKQTSTIHRKFSNEVTTTKPLRGYRITSVNSLTPNIGEAFHYFFFSLWGFRFQWRYLFLCFVIKLETCATRKLEVVRYLPVNWRSGCNTIFYGRNWKSVQGKYISITKTYTLTSVRTEVHGGCCETISFIWYLNQLSVICVQRLQQIYRIIEVTQPATAPRSAPYSSTFPFLSSICWLRSAWTMMTSSFLVLYHGLMKKF